MGADMLMNAFIVRKDRRTKGQRELLNIAVDYVHSLSEDEMQDEAWCQILEMDSEGAYPDANESAGPYIDAVEMLLGNVEHGLTGSRDTFQMILGENYWLIGTGGMSWGDDPCETYTAFCRLDEMPSTRRLYDAMEMLWWSDLEVRPKEPVPVFTTVEEANAWMEAKCRR